MRESLLTYVQYLIENKLPFLLLRQSNEEKVTILHQKDQVNHKTAPDKLTYATLSKFEITENQIFVYGDVIKSFKWKFSPIDVRNVAIELPGTTWNQHVQDVKTAVNRIQNTTLQKVVLSLSHQISNSTPSLELLSNLLNTYPAAHCYFCQHPEAGSWMGATPETLISYKNGMLKTMSLAGTKKAITKEEVEWTNKEIQEQQLVTSFITNALDAIAENPIKVYPLETVQAGQLFHLRTQIEVPIRYKNLSQAIRQLHPTPAVCGLPKDQAQSLIAELEKYDREFYTGYFGIQNPQEETADYFVNLRCMKVESDQITLYAGGGITALSDPESEVQEIENKLMTMASIL